MTKRARRIIIAILLLSSVASLLCFGILGFGRGGESNFDGAVLYAAGRTWLDGGNPYKYDEISRVVTEVKEISSLLSNFGFFYPPQSAALLIPIALLNYPFAKIVWLVINLLSIAAIVAMTVYTINRHPKKNGDKIGSWVMAAVIIGNPFTTHVVWMGQTSLIAFAATMAAWIFNQRKKWVLSGIFLGLASFKPQMCILLIIWFFLERNWKILAVSLGTVGVMSIYPLMLQGPIYMLKAWHEGIKSSYSSLTFNAPGFVHKVGLESLLNAAGLHSPGLNILAVILVALLWVVRRRINTEDILGILMGIMFTFLGYAHDYDYVGLIPILTLLWLYYHNHRLWIGVIIPAFLLFFPQRLVRVFGFPVLEHWRTIVVLILLTVVVTLSVKHQFKHRSQAIAS